MAPRTARICASLYPAALRADSVWATLASSSGSTVESGNAVAGRRHVRLCLVQEGVQADPVCLVPGICRETVGVADHRWLGMDQRLLGHRRKIRPELRNHRRAAQDQGVAVLPLRQGTVEGLFCRTQFCPDGIARGLLERPFPIVELQRIEPDGSADIAAGGADAGSISPVTLRSGIQRRLAGECRCLLFDHQCLPAGLQVGQRLLVGIDLGLRLLGLLGRGEERATEQIRSPSHPLTAV